MTTYTPNLKLEKYDNNDIPNLRDQYNASMDILDANTGQFNGEVAKLNTAILNTNTAIQGNTTKLEELTAEVATNETATIANKNAIDELKNNQQNQQTTLNTAVDNIAVLQETSENHTNSITTINGELAGLGIESVDDAVALKSDIDVANAQAVENQADIAANTMFGNWEYRDGQSPGSTWFTSFNVGLMISPNKSYIRVIGGFSTGAVSPTYTKTLVPGLSNKYGVRTGISVPEITNAPRLFTYAGVQFIKTEIPEGYILGISDYAIGSDHQLYVNVSGQNTIDADTKALYFQIPMVINVSGFNAVD